MDQRLPTPSFLLQLHYYQTKLPEWYLLNYGIREVWCMHPPNRIDIGEQMKEHFENILMPYHTAAAFDAGTTRNITMSNEVSRIFCDDTKWLLEDYVNGSLPEGDTLLDIYGGWQSHLYCWERIVAYKINSRVDIPVLVLEDDAVISSHFITKVKRIMNNMPSDWKVLSLDKENISCHPNQYGVCRLPHFHLGRAYIVRDFYTAKELWNQNNLKEPPNLRYDNNHNPISWTPNYPKNWPGYVVITNELAENRYFKTKYPHSPAFTPRDI